MNNYFQCAPKQLLTQFFKEKSLRYVLQKPRMDIIHVAYHVALRQDLLCAKWTALMNRPKNNSQLWGHRKLY